MTNTTDDSTRREWDAPAYDRLNAPMTQRGNDAVARLQLRGDETVLDAGCGTGEVTATLLERLPQGRVVALDGSRQMLEAARERFAGDARVSYVYADLTQPLPLDEPVDAIVSTSTFHWVRDHEALFHHLAAVLKPGGQLVVDCGGAGNIAAVLAILDELGHADFPWNYAGIEETRAQMRAAGFADDADVRLVPRVSHHTREELERFLTSVVLRTYVTELGPDAGGALVREVADRLPDGELHWVRLEIVARLSAAGAAG
jgi:trans-aconitate 2-methyltransferase